MVRIAAEDDLFLLRAEPAWKRVFYSDSNISAKMETNYAAIRVSNLRVVLEGFGKRLFRLRVRVREFSSNNFEG